MGRSSAYWRSNLYPDQGAEPAPRAPYKDLPKPIAARFRLLREGMLKLPGAVEHVRWMGEKMRWGWEYALGSRKLCWLHAMENGIGLTFTLTDHEFREAQALSRTPAGIADAIRAGQQTGPVRWCRMEVGDKKTAEAFVSFARRKAGWLKAETPTLVSRRTGQG